MLADAVLSALRGFATEVATWTNQGSLLSITGHIAQIENAVATDIHAGETAAKEVLADLYSAFHGHATEPAAPAAEPVPVPAVPIVEAPVSADPTPAPQEAPATATPTASSTDSAPSSTASPTPSAATDTPAASA